MSSKPENQNPKSGDENPAEESIRQKKHLENAIGDAQYLIRYAATRYPHIMDHEVVKTLIEVKDKNEMKPGEEADFWIAYQKLSNQVKPVTAESIKAGLPTETDTAKVKNSKNPFAPLWLKLQGMSRVQKVMNWYIATTGAILLVVLSFQIYWVVGNQLSTQLGNLQQEERKLDPAAYDDLGLFDKDFESLQTQSVQTALVFLKWSSPWIKYVSTDGLNLFAENTQRIAQIDARLQEINNQLSADPDGKIAAANDPEKQSFLLEQLDFLNNQITNVQGQINTLQDQKSADEAELAGIKENRDAELKSLADQEATLNSELSGLKLKLITISENTPTATNTSTDTPTVATPTGTTTPTDEGTDKPATENQTGTPETEKGNNLNVPPTGTPDPNVTKCLSEGVDPTKIDQTLLRKCIDIAAQLDSIALFRQKKSESTQKEIELKANIEDITKKLNIESNEINGLITKAKSYLDAPEASRQSKQSELQDAIRALPDSKQSLGTQLDNLNQAVTYIQSQIDALQINIVSPSTTPDPNPNTTALTKVGAQIVKSLSDEKIRLEAEKYDLQIKSIQNDSGPAQLAGRFVLDILEKYLLPLFYGILGAAVFVLRSLTRQVRHMTYSEATGIQHLSHLALGALSGILVGWFSNLLSSDSFVSSVSPMAIAFLVGYNIELVFAKIDEYLVTQIRGLREKTSPVTEKSSQNTDSPSSQSE